MTTSPKVSTLSSSARRALRAAAHHLDPVVMMGQHGLTPAVLHEIDLALTAHALIKVRAGSDEREIRDGYLAEICEKLACESVQHLGKLFVLWRNADGAGNADKSAEHDAAAVTASNDPKALAARERGPRSKLPSERAAERANVAPAGRSGGYAGRGGSPSGGRGVPSGGRAAPTGGRSDNAPGPRWRYGETPPDAPRREGWAPKDRRGAARFGEGGDDSRRRDGPPSYGTPRGRAAATGGGYAGSSASTGAGKGYRGAAPTGGRSGDGDGGGGGGNSGGGGSYGGDNRGGPGGGGSSYGGRGGTSSYGGQGDGAPRARWGERREPAQGGAGGGGYGQGGGNFGNDRGAPAPRSTYSRGNDAGGADRGAPRSGGGRGGWGNRDGVTGKPSGFSRGGAGGAASGAAPRARRRFG